MGTMPPFMAYPLFRLTICLAAGIFLSDTLLAGCVSWTEMAVAFGFSVGLLFFFYRTFSYRYRMLFGVLCGISFMLLGGALALKSRSEIFFHWDGRKQVYSGVVESVPYFKGKTMRAEVFVSSVCNPGDTLKSRSVNRSVLLYWMPDSLAQPLRCGDSVCFYARIARPDFKEAGFDYAEYLMRKGIAGTAVVYAGDWRRVHNGSGLTFRQKASVWQRQITDTYSSWGFSGDTLAVVSALTVGDTHELTPELKAVYNASGASHVLSLSGLHVGILAGILTGIFYPLCRRWRSGRQIVAFLVVVALWIFAVMSGLSPSMVRAVVMFSLYVAASLFTRERFSGFLALTLAAFVMLLYQPFYLFDVSFQLSFVAVLALLCLYPVFSGWCPFRGRAFRYVWNMLALSFAAQLGTLPFVLHYFGTFPTYFLLANLVVSPLSVCILGSALAAFVLCPVPVLGAWAAKSLGFFTGALNGAMEWVQRLAGSQITSVYVSAFQALMLCLCLSLLYVYWHGRKASHVIGILTALILFLLAGIIA